MMHKINFEITIDTNYLNDEEYLKIRQPFYDDIVKTEPRKMSFDELVKTLALDKKEYFVSTIIFSNIIKDDFEIQTTKIEIRG